MAFTDVEMSILAQLAYQDIPVNASLYDVLDDNKTWLETELGENYGSHLRKLMEKVEGKKYQVVDSSNTSLSGFAAYAFKTPDNEVVVSARGTEQNPIQNANDWFTDVGLGVNVEVQQHRDMEAFVDRLEKYGYDGYYFAGHSLGGNVATHGAACVNDPSKVKGVYAFNAPGFNEAYWIYNGWKLNRVNNIKNIVNEYDNVSSVLHLPGDTVVIESERKRKGILGDHSVCNYTINEDGTFKANKTGRKRVQTNVGTAIGALGEYIGNATGSYDSQLWIYGLLGRKTKCYMTRDFSDASKEQMLNLVSQVENEKWCNFTDWVGDRWYDYEELIGSLDIRHYINDVNSYHKKVIDKNNATAKTIEKIFDAVHNVDAAYAKNIGNAVSTMEELKHFVESMTQIVAPGKGNFTGHNITGSLAPILSEISEASIRQIVDSLVQEIDGKKIFDEDAILDYIKKDPGQMTDEEKQALLEVIGDMQETVAYYKTQWTMGDDLFGADFLHASGWETEDLERHSYIVAGLHYHDQYVNLLSAIIEQGEDSNTFAAALLKAGNGENELTLGGLEATMSVGKIFGDMSAAAYLAKLKTEHFEGYLGKVSLDAGMDLESEAKLENLSEAFKRKKEQQDKWLEDQGLFDKEKITKYFDQDGNEIDEKNAPDFYERLITLGEIKGDVSGRLSLFVGDFDTPLGGKARVTVGEAEGHLSGSAGIYLTGKDGKNVISPGFAVDAGVSVTGVKASYENQLLGDEMLGLNVDGSVEALSASAKGSVKANLMGLDEQGNVVFDPQVNAGLEAEAVLVEAEASAGANILGGEVEVTGSVKVGVGAKANVGLKDGVIKCEIGASLGVGFDVAFEVDVGGMVNTVSDRVSSAWNDIHSGWNSLWSG